MDVRQGPTWDSEHIQILNKPRFNLNHSAAFDCLDKDILCKKLELYGFNHIFTWFCVMKLVWNKQTKRKDYSFTLLAKLGHYFCGWIQRLYARNNFILLCFVCQQTYYYDQNTEKVATFLGKTISLKKCIPKKVVM